MSLIISTRRLPCGHGHVRLSEEPQEAERRCSLCKRRWLVRVELASEETRRLTGRELLVLRWEEL